MCRDLRGVGQERGHPRPDMQVGPERGHSRPRATPSDPAKHPPLHYRGERSMLPPLDLIPSPQYAQVCNLLCPRQLFISNPTGPHLAAVISPAIPRCVSHGDRSPWETHRGIAGETNARSARSRGWAGLLPFRLQTITGLHRPELRLRAKRNLHQGTWRSAAQALPQGCRCHSRGDDRQHHCPGGHSP